MATNAKGSVTSLSSLYRAEETRKAALMVDQRIAENQNELQTLNLFLSENANLIKLVHKLPDELSHNVMVPFGKAAFFPGRLIHTNEFLVLLGEGYYAERTSKQTVEMLGRRGKGLESQIESLKAMMEDLKAEASFFLSTADEAAEGVVEIREDYIEEIPSERFSDQAAVSKVDVVSTSKDAGIRGDDEDEEYARIMAKLDELEREELAAESVEGDEGQYFDQSLKIQEGDNQPSGWPNGLVCDIGTRVWEFQSHRGQENLGTSISPNFTTPSSRCLVFLNSQALSISIDFPNYHGIGARLWVISCFYQCFQGAPSRHHLRNKLDNRISA
ncbi:hypothetical protein Scep_028307 [Stephania cephalantha]|uniref:RNA polymerase II subunit 5-mediating protein homolog n=1 Tax=Stephania cephalantha TaxID=152367 RepID=A0AAP0EBW9_9MAGN